MKTKYFFASILFPLLLNVSCSEEPKALKQTDLPSTTPEESSPFSDDAILYFGLGSKWETAQESDKFENWGSCEITANSVQTSKTCELKIPEAQMYYSHLEFRMGTKSAASCPILSFFPYYYKRSNNAAYSPPDAKAGDTPLDCSSANTTEKKCFGGAAPQLIVDFPEYTGSYIHTHVASEVGYVLDSENKLRTFGGSRVNYLATNDLDVGSRVTLNDGSLQERFVDAGQGAPFVDYYVTCKNYWGETMYSMKLMISDENMEEDEGGASNDDYLDWL